jgi:small-conductance mechanosensitive channel
VVSSLPVVWKEPLIRGLWSLFLVSLVLTLLHIIGGLIYFYGRRRQLSEYTVRLGRNIIIIIIAIVTVLIILDIWSLPDSPFSAAYTWLKENWPIVVIPVVIFALTLIALFWLRRLVYRRLERWLKRTNWQPSKIAVQAIKEPSVLWCLILSASLALAISNLPAEWKNSISKVLWSLFVISLALTLLHIIDGLFLFYGRRRQLSEHATRLSRNVANIVIYVVLGLVLLDIWGIPTTPLLLLIAVVALATALAFRDAVPNFFAGFQINTSQDIKVGDYIKLDTEEEGYVTEINWINTHVKALDESIIIVPNSRLIRSTVINYGRPLKKAKEPFHFVSRTHLTELTGLKVKNLRELVDVLKRVPDPVIYYHTHHFLEEHHHLTPEPSNDFAVWVSDVLGDEALGERLASVNTFGFSNLGALKESLVGIIEEHLAAGSNNTEAMPGREFHFLKSVSVILPTPYVAHDLREFVETVRKVSLGSLYFHVFESRLRLGRGLNDFSIWLQDSLGESELADEIARLDPYTYTLEGLRLALIQLIEKRIK